MSISADCPLAQIMADQLRSSREELVDRWFQRIQARVALDPNHIFPSDELLDHVPLLIDGLADYLEDPAEEVTADVPLISKATELGEMRHAQRFELYEILKEYEILGGILFHFLTSIVDAIEQPCTRAELLACAHRLFRGVTIIQQVTIVRYMRLAHEEVSEREARLRGFNRALSHEVRSQVGALRGAIDMLNEEFVLEDPTMRQRFRAVAVQNIEGIEHTMTNLIELSRTDTDVRSHRNVLLPEAVLEVVRQLRHFAEARGVEVRVASDLPRIEVPASAVELALTNYISNAVKYHDPDRLDRWVAVRAGGAESSGGRSQEVVVEVSDNGRGVPSEARERLFTRFFRAHTEMAPQVEGTGLGLSLVRETIESLGGRVWADHDREGETVFAFSLPGRRSSDTQPPMQVGEPETPPA